MNVPTYYKVSIVKYQNKTNTTIDIETETFIDEVSIQTDEIFDHDRNIEKEQLIKEEQYAHRSWNKDQLLDYYNINLDIVDEYLNCNHTIISENYYNLFSIYNKK